MIEYDASVIVTFAENLYDQAERVVALTTFAGILVGALLGFAIGSAFQGTSLTAVIGAVVVGVLAFNIAQQKAFAMRLQAQTALCQVQIELNTRTES
jgi:outer membrane lipoprotein SlyB